MNEQQVRAMLIRECGKAGSQRAWAEAHSLSPSFISDVIHGRRALTIAVLQALRVENLPARYRRIRE